MELIPAIDLKAGTCVRLLQGAFDAVTQYSVAPLDLARRYREAGAGWLHVVDLDGARAGSLQNTRALEELAGIGELHVQIGGGIRDRKSAESLFAAGAARIVVGSLAVDSPREIGEWLELFGPERIVIAFDVRLGAQDGVPYLATHGWERTTSRSLWSALQLFAERGLRHVLCTDIARDGALSGPNVALYETCVERFPDIEFQASGGVADLADLVRLSRTGVSAAISGRALLEERITLEEVRSFLPRG